MSLTIVLLVSGDREDPEDLEKDDAEPVSTEEQAGPSAQRTRSAVAIAASFLLAAIVGIVVVTGGSDGPVEITNECIQAWNDDPIAPTQDGIHAFGPHGYRQVYATRVDSGGGLLTTDDGAVPDDEPDARCVLVFAAPQLDFEPDYGVHVYDEGRWVLLVTTDKVTLDQIEELQQEALDVANATLLSNGTLEQTS